MNTPSTCFEAQEIWKPCPRIEILGTGYGDSKFYNNVPFLYVRFFFKVLTLLCNLPLIVVICHKCHPYILNATYIS